MTLTIRKIERTDNNRLHTIIRSVLREFDGDWPDSDYSELNLSDLYSHFAQPGSNFFVAMYNGEMVGGMGYAPLGRSAPGVCELQRAFLLPAARGKGIGKALLIVAF